MFYENVFSYKSTVSSSSSRGADRLIYIGKAPIGQEIFEPKQRNGPTLECPNKVDGSMQTGEGERSPVVQEAMNENGPILDGTFETRPTNRSPEI